RKGLLVLLEAFRSLAATRDDVELDVIGDGPERERAAALLPADLRDRVRFHGRVDDAELAARLASTDLYVSPALGGESFGIVLLEAMAAGAAVVASDLPGYRSVVTDGRDGRLVPPGDPTALAEAVARLLDDPARRQRLAAAGRRQAAAHDWSVVAAALRERYLRAVRRGR
ncbi:MAG: glycosyltransferase, partial [Nitriliruptoraceae bacterium]